MRGNEPFAQLQVLFAVVAHPLGELVGMRQKEVDVKGARGSQHRCRRIEGGAFLAIGSSLFALAQVQEQFSGTYRLSHPLAPF